MSKWKLYWVISDGEEDCFVVAKNSRSAIAVEKYGCWIFHNLEDFDVIRVMDIPDKYELIYKKREFKKRRKEFKDISEFNVWPDYATDCLLKKLGAEIRYIDDKKEVLIDDIVYAPGYVYPIGKRAMKELYEFDNDRKMDITNISYEGVDEVIERMLGKAITTIHRIENYITESYIFGIGVERFSKYPIWEMTKLWKDKLTFGRLINLMEENFIINEDIKKSLQLFLTQRNKIAHGLTMDERFNIDTFWGKKEIVGYLALFLKNASLLEPAIESAYFFTVGFSFYIMKSSGDKFTKEQEKLMEKFEIDSYVQEKLNLFFDVFEFK